MTKLEKKLIELGYELSMTQKIFTPEYKIIKTYVKEVDNDNFNFINICNNKILKINASNEDEMQKDLEILKGCEENATN